MTAPLKGLRVLELARILAGPWAGQALADLGADVIKVESPDGDDTRAWGPPFIERGGDLSAAYFHSCNRGKTSVVADLRNVDDLTHVQALAASADVVIENFKLGGLEKYALDYPSLADRNPQLVYCSITGFGQTGPRAAQPGYDLLIQAMSGVMDITGAPDGPPMKMGVAFADIFSGLHAVIGIQAALSERARSGQGQRVDISLFDCMTGVLANQAQNYFATGYSPSRRGNAHPNLTPYEVFEASGGHLVIAVGNDRQFAALCRVLALEDMVEKFATNRLRLEHRSILFDRLQKRISAFQLTTLIELLTDAGVPAGPINSLAEAFTDPQFTARNMEIAPEGDRGLRTPIVFSRSSLSHEKGVPKLGNAELQKVKWSEP